MKDDGFAIERVAGSEQRMGHQICHGLLNRYGSEGEPRNPLPSTRHLPQP